MMFHSLASLASDASDSNFSSTTGVFLFAIKSAPTPNTISTTTETIHQGLDEAATAATCGESVAVSTGSATTCCDAEEFSCDVWLVFFDVFFKGGTGAATTVTGFTVGIGEPDDGKGGATLIESGFVVEA